MLFGNKKKYREEIQLIAQKAEEEVRRVKEEAKEHCQKADKAVAKMAMQQRQYDKLLEMDYGDDYIDPLTGEVDSSIDFKRNRDIYSEDLKDTGSPFIIE